MLSNTGSSHKQILSTDRTKILTENEWFDLLDQEMQEVEITEMEKRNLARTLVYHFMTIDDIIELTEEQLINKFHIRQRSLIEQISEWQTHFTNRSSSVSSFKDKPLVGLYEAFRNRMTDDEIIEAIQKLQAITNKQTENFVQSYSNLIDALINFGSKKYTEDLQRIWFRCRSCSHLVWIARDMGIFTSFPACFRCQVRSLTQAMQRTANPIAEISLD